MAQKFYDSSHFYNLFQNKDNSSLRIINKFVQNLTILQITAHSNRLILWLSFALFAIAFVLLRIQYHYYFGGDAIAYLSVTEHLAEGDFFKSINAYFSPLISWLMLPFYLITHDGILSFNIVHFLLGILAVSYIFKTLATTQQLSLVWLTIPLAALMACCSAMFFTADIILATVVIVYMYYNIHNKNLSWKLDALFGVLLYLAKAIGFYAFIGFLFFRFIIQQPNKTKLTELIKTLVLFFVLSAIWICIISYKQGEFTISTAGKYNKLIIHKNKPVLHPTDSLKLLPPSVQERYTAWEDMYTHTRHIQKQHDEGTIFDRVNYVGKQVYVQLNTVIRHVVPLLLLIIICVFMVRGKPNKSVLLLCAMALLLSLPYLLYFTEMRYLVTSGILFMLGNILCLHQLGLHKNIFYWIASFVLAVSISLGAYHIAFRTPTSEEIASFNIEKYLPDTKNQHYASYYAYQFPQIAYNKKWKNYGGTKAFDNDSIALSDSLNKHQINFLIYPKTVSLPQNVAAQFTKIESPSFGTFVLFQRK